MPLPAWYFAWLAGILRALTQAVGCFDIRRFGQWL